MSLAGPGDPTTRFCSRPGQGALRESRRLAVRQLRSLHLTRGDVAHRWPQFLPDGRHFLFFVRAKLEHRGVYVGSLDGTADKQLLKTDANAIYVSPGYLLYVNGDTMLAQPFDARRLRVTGNRFTIEDRVGRQILWRGFGGADRPAGPRRSDPPPRPTDVVRPTRQPIGYGRPGSGLHGLPTFSEREASGGMRG